MNIYVLDSNWMCRDHIQKVLRGSFPSVPVTTFNSVHAFLLKAANLPSDCLVILEHYLALIEIGKDEEETRQRMTEVYSLFPEVTQNWSHQNAAERVIRCVRQTNKIVPFVIYTNSDEEWIDQEILLDPRTKWCFKDGENDDEFLAAILSFGL